MNPIDTADLLRLVGEYERNKGNAVAMVDESYSAPRDTELDLNFYVLTAVVIGSAQMDELREGIREIADGDRWHTRKVFHQDGGPERVKDMLHFLGDGNEVCLVSKQMAIDADDSKAEAARASCLEALLIALQSGVVPHGPVNLTVLEKRVDNGQNDHDRWVYRRAISSGAITDAMRIAQVSPGVENLLWLPDTVCYAVRRDITDKGARRPANLLPVIADSVLWL